MNKKKDDYEVFRKLYIPPFDIKKSKDCVLNHFKHSNKTKKEMLEKFGAVRRALPLPPGIPPAAAAKMGDPMRNAPVMIIVSAKEGGTSFEDSVLAMGNMFIAAASLGIMSGWDHATVKQLFSFSPELKKALIPEGYEVYAAAFFGYPGPDVKDRGERKGTVDFR